MKTRKLSLLLLFFLLTSSTFSQTNWIQKSSLVNNGRANSINCTLNGKGYVGLGINSSSTYLNDIWEYNPLDNSWTQKANFPGTARAGASAFVIKGKMYVCFGQNTSTMYKDVWEYNPTNDTWTQKKDFPGQARYNTSGFVIGDSVIYLGTGTYNSGNNYLYDFWMYNPTSDSWTQKANFPGSKRMAATAFTIDGIGYLGSGLYDTYTPTKDFWKYTPSSNSWSQIADIPATPRYALVSFVINNIGYIGTGSTVSPASDYNSDFWKYNVNGNTWENVSSDSKILGRSSAAAFVIDNKAYVGMGRGATGSLCDLYMFSESSMNAIIYSHNKIVSKNSEFNFPVKTKNYFADKNINAYQFYFEYDTTMLKYVSSSIDATIADKGQISVNASQKGTLRIGWTRNDTLKTEGELVNIKLQAIKEGQSQPKVKYFLYNTDTITSVENGTIYCEILGDIDSNKYVQAYDAGIALKASVGINAITNDPFPWNQSRYFRANVDGIDSITANDALLILQYSVGLLDKFPVESKLKKAVEVSDVNVEVKDGHLVITAITDVEALNISISGSNLNISKPIYTQSNLLTAENISSSKYAIGFCTLDPIKGGSEIMRIPVNNTEIQALELNINVNSTAMKTNLNINSVNDKLVAFKNISIFPNPANDRINIANMAEGTDIRIFDIIGNQVMNFKLTNKIVNIENLSEGLYIVKSTDEDGAISVGKFTKMN